MKFCIGISTTAIAVAFFSAGADAECAFCPDGLSADAGAAVPDSDGQTCGSLSEYAATLSDVEACANIQPAQVLCCPSQAEPAENPTGAGDSLAGEGGGVLGGLLAGFFGGGTEGANAGDLSEGFGNATGAGGGMVEGLLAGLFGGGAEVIDPCSICPDGATVADDFALPSDNQDDEEVTCGQVLGFASMMEADSPTCDAMKMGAMYCCPSQMEQPDNPCSVCPDGAEAADDFVLPGDEEAGEETTCGQVLGFASMMEADDMSCSPMKMAAMYCCPSQMEQPDNPCSVCPDGAEAGDDFVLPGDEAGGEETTCGQVLGFASTIEADNMACRSMKNTAMYCCPSQMEQLDNPCSVCPDGAEVGDDFVLPGDETTCGQVLGFASMMEADDMFCESTKMAAMYCCPSQMEQLDNPCSVCPDGAEAGDDFVLPGDAVGGEETTCGQVLGFASTMEADDMSCSPMKMIAMYCCPSQMEQLDNPCSVCPDGAEAADDFVLPGDEEAGEQMTCGQVLGFANTIEADDMSCESMKTTAMYCCPSQMEQADTPCPVCSGGITADETFIIPDPNMDGMTCGEVIALSASVEASSEMCSEGMGAELYCCPTVEGSPNTPDLTNVDVTADVEATTTATTSATTATSTQDPVDETPAMPDPSATPPSSTPDAAEDLELGNGVGRLAEATITTIAVAIVMLFA